MRVVFDDAAFMKEIKNVVDYSSGFVTGIQRSKPIMFRNIGYRIKEILTDFIDTTARMEPQRLHHIYEWYQTGSPNARLFSVDCITTGSGISYSYILSQSRSVANGSKTPFYDKANIMENGMPVTIRPRQAKALVFQDGAETVFTKGPVTIQHPGGEATAGAFASTIKLFFDSYLSQVFLEVSGIRDQMNDLSLYANNFKRAKTGGFPLGVKVGSQWALKIGTIE